MGWSGLARGVTRCQISCTAVDTHQVHVMRPHSNLRPRSTSSDGHKQSHLTKRQATINNCTTTRTTTGCNTTIILILLCWWGCLTGAILVFRFSTFLERQRPHSAVCRSRLQLPPPQRSDLTSRFERQARQHQSMAITAIHDRSGLACSTRSSDEGELALVLYLKEALILVEL